MELFDERGRPNWNAVCDYFCAPMTENARNAKVARIVDLIKHNSSTQRMLETFQKRSEK